LHGDFRRAVIGPDTGNRHGPRGAKSDLQARGCL
jgi:hypothetical protein